jgi:hypothetical protein
MKRLIFTCYFNGKDDPQFPGMRHRAKNFDAIYLWLKSLTLCGLKGVIFTDNLPKVHEPFEHNVILVPYKLRTGWTILEERHLCYLEYLEKHPEIEEVVFTDLFDCEFYRDPFPLLAGHDLLAGYGGRLHAPIAGNAWIEEEMARAYGEIWYKDMPVLCAGLWGGRRDVVMMVLRAMVRDFEQINPTGHVDMSVFIKCAYDLIPRGSILLGEPFCSKFKRYEISGDFAIRHK